MGRAGGDARDLERLFEVPLLVRIDGLQHLAAREDDCVILVVRFAVAQNGVLPNSAHTRASREEQASVKTAVGQTARVRIPR